MFLLRNKLIIFAAALLSLPGCSQDRRGASVVTRKGAPKVVNKHNLRLVVSAQGDRRPVFVPEQSAIFDLVLHNDGAEQVETPSLDGNQSTPNYRVFDASGQMVIDVTPSDLFARFDAEMGEPEPEEFAMIQLAPGASADTWFDLWSHDAPLPKGRYELVARHMIGANSDVFVESNRLAFEIVEAEADQLALSYENGLHEASVIAWLAKGEGSRDWDLLARLSVEERHGSAQRSGRLIGTASPGSRLSVSDKPPGVQEERRFQCRDDSTATRETAVAKWACPATLTGCAAGPEISGSHAPDVSGYRGSIVRGDRACRRRVRPGKGRCGSLDRSSSQARDKERERDTRADAFNEYRWWPEAKAEGPLPASETVFHYHPIVFLLAIAFEPQKD